MTPESGMPIQHSTFNIQHSPRVAITGIGIICPFGRGKLAARDALREGRSGIRLIQQIDTSALWCKIGGEVPDAERGKFDRFTSFALAAAEEAVEQARFQPQDAHRFGTIIGTGMGGCETLDSSYKRIYADNQPRVAPTVIAWSMYNAAASAVAMRFGAKG